ncbi:glycoside hydrolase family 79 protein [Poronia punctata]|nr:glycoside hydrolase family 79 protein [Poronia punctata]
MFSSFWHAVGALARISFTAVTAVSFTIPGREGTEHTHMCQCIRLPLGSRLDYLQNVTTTTQCLSSWKELTAHTLFSHVKNAADVPASLTFGSSLTSLAPKYKGSGGVGLNRGKNIIQNTMDATKVAVSRMSNLLAIELEMNLMLTEGTYYPWNGQPIASGTWSPATDAASQNNGAIIVASPVHKQGVIQVGNSNDSPPTWDAAAELVAAQNETVRQFIHGNAHHNYPGGSIFSPMSHRDIASNLQVLDSDVATALNECKQYIFGETNSVSGGGVAGVSPTFGAALRTMDYAARAVYRRISRTYFHHWTIGNCQYCFWGPTAFMANAAPLTELDNGDLNYAAYVTFDSDGASLRALSYKPNHFDDSGTRSSQLFKLRFLSRQARAC